MLIWPDIFGLRPAMRTMGKRLAGSGYSVLVVNPFYRTGKPTATGATPIKEMMAFRKGMSPETDMTDAKTFVAWLDAQRQVNKHREEGRRAGLLHGRPAVMFSTAAGAYPIASALARRSTAAGSSTKRAARTVRILLAAATKASFLIAIAENDDKQRPDDKTVLKDTFDRAKLAAEIEVYQAAHGWCPPDRRSTTSRRRRKRGAACSLCTKVLA